MTILKNIIVTTKYTDKSGQERKRYTTVGHLHSGEYGEYITLNAEVNLAVFPRKEGDNRVMANLYDPKGKDEPPAKPRQSAPAGEFKDDEPPW